MVPKEPKYETYRESTDLIKSCFVKLEESVTRIASNGQPLTPVHIMQLNTRLGFIANGSRPNSTRIL